MPEIRVGCTGWAYDDWVGSFYDRATPSAQRLGLYAKVFDAVEIDSSFYAPPSRDQVAHWNRTTPAGFLFTAKLPRAITHEARLRRVETRLENFLDVLSPLRTAHKLGPLLAQFPASFERYDNVEALEAFLGLVPDGVDMAIELRHASWWRPETYELLKAHGATLTWSVNGDADAPPVVTGGFLYARIVGDRELTRFHSIQRDRTEEMRTMAGRLLGEGHSVSRIIVMLNNHFMGFAPETAQIMRELLGVGRSDPSAAARKTGQRGLEDFI